MRVNTLVSVLIPWCWCKPMFIYSFIAMSLSYRFLILTQSSNIVFTAWLLTIKRLCLVLSKNAAALSRHIDNFSTYCRLSYFVRLGRPVLLRVRYMVQPWDFETWCACSDCARLRDCDWTLTFKNPFWCHKHLANYQKINQWSLTF